ncbi:MAG: AAA family ATPase [Marinisporobacter sp.]|nr:AAA family ATPase [Marinisporobacter sp.]
MKSLKQIAVYGKGGIGKSTISSNLSAALAIKDKKVLQIGCDPKHDSTRLLLGKEKITTVLDYIKVTSPEKWRLEDILFEGYKGVDCVEAGGPKPGVGCAGRGILTTFDLLEKLDIKKLGHEIIIYDVLGDVVCGGFAVPIRHEYADVVYIVTSGEFMSIYAANNILKGIKNYDENLKRVGGIIFNKRGIEGEEERIKKFSEAVKLPICETFPRSDEFTKAERMGIPLVEMKDSFIASKFLNLADKIIENEVLYEALPLEDEELEEIVLENKKENTFVHKDKNIIKTKKMKVKNEDSSKTRQFLSKNVLMREPLHGCAFNGAVNIGVQIEDAITIAHGPRSCSHISYQTITSTGRRSLFERGVLLPTQIIPPLVSSQMNEGVMVFGGIEELKNKISQLKEYDPSAMFVITTCPSGIIGDDVDMTKSMGSDNQPIIPIKTDGNITGDYLQGMIHAYIEIARGLIKKDVHVEDNLVNIIAEKSIAKNTERNFETMKKLLGSIGIKINCRFICKTKVKYVQNFLKAKVNILAYDDYMGRIMKDFFKEEYGANFSERPFPVGFSETKRWLYEIAKSFHKKEKVDHVIKLYESLYEEEIEKVKPYLKGKRIMIVTYNHRIDWIIETALKLDMEIIKLCILNYSQENLFRTKFKDEFEIELNYDQNKRSEDIKKLNPQIVISNYTSKALDGAAMTDTIPLCPDVGFFSGLNLAKRWAGLFKMNLREGWKEDEGLFSKYYGR